jgi:hypothetical protein
MNQADAIDLSFIPTAINEIHRLLHEAAVAEKEDDSKRERAALIRAGAEAMVALEKLQDHPLWEELRQERQRQLQQWQDLGLPVVDKLLVELGYKPPPPAKSLIEVGDTSLRLTVGLPDPEGADPITKAQQAISDLIELIGELMGSIHNKIILKNLLEKTSKALAGTLVAAIVIPAVQAGVRTVSPPAAELLRNLVDHVGHILPALSMGLVADIGVRGSGIRPTTGPRVTADPVSPTAEERRPLEIEIPPSTAVEERGPEGRRTREALYGPEAGINSERRTERTVLDDLDDIDERLRRQPPPDQPPRPAPGP